MALPKTYLWNNNGTKQSDRLPKALSGDYVKIDERSFDDLLAQMAEYAKHLTYFDDNLNPSGDWTAFFRDVYDYDKHKLKKERIEALTEAGDVPPHLALMMAFIKMFQVQQDNLNTLTDKHLQFYYKDILGFKPRQGENGMATVFFEPVKNAPEVFIPKGTLFDAGKDANKKPITYRSVRDVTVNQVKVKETLRLSNKETIYDNFGFIISSSELAFLENENKSLNTNYSGKLISFEKDRIVIKASNNLNTLFGLLNNPFSVKVTNSKNFVMENPQGALANQTGTTPFGHQPKKGDYFTIKIPYAKDFSINNVHNQWNNVASKDITKENNTKLVLVKDTDISWSTYTKKLQSYIGALQSHPKGTTGMPQPPKAPSLAEPITIDYTINLENCQIQYFSPFGSHPFNEKAQKERIEDELRQMKTEQPLFLKIEGLRETCVLTFHFEMSPFKYKLDGEYGDKAAIWYYYTEKGWKAFADSDIISDTTLQFRRSGIVQLKFSNAVAAAANNTKHELWLKIEANTLDDPFEALEAVRTQAVEVELDPQSEGQIEVGAALPVDSITKAKTSFKGIKKIEQPYFGGEGRKDETHELFYARVSEALRHKGRAWNSWDYERLVLEKFPKVASVKCLPCYDCNTHGKVEMKPGHVTLVVVPDCQAIPQPNLLRPVVGNVMEKDIADYISQRSSGFIQLHVISPNYKEAKVHCNITLRKGLTDVNHYKSLINAQLIGYLAPWSLPETPEIEFRTNQNESHIQEFIENLECVDHFDEFRLTIDNEKIAHGMPLQPDDVTSIITSAEQHELYVQIFEK